MIPNARRIQYQCLLLALTVLSSVAFAADYTGQVLTSDGKPVKAATVYLVHESNNQNNTPPSTPPDLPTTRTDDNGDFHFSSVDSTGNIFFIAGADGFGLSSAIYNPALPTEIRLRPRTDLTLTIQTADNKPVPNTTISLRQITLPQSLTGAPNSFWIPLADRSPFTATTDANGNCTFPGLPQAARAIFFTEDDRFASLSSSNDGVQLTADPQTTDRIIHVTPASTISGKVLYGPTTKPAPNIYVLAISGDGASHTFTSNDGSYTLKKLSPGDYTLELHLRGNIQTSSTARAIEFFKVAPGSAHTDVDFTLIPGVIITGKVLAADDAKPIPDVAIAIHGPARPGSAGGPQIAHTDANGSFTAHVPPGQQFITIDSNTPAFGFGPPIENEKSVTIPDGGNAAVEFRLPRAVNLNILGKVVDPDGKPVAGATITLTTQFQGTYTALTLTSTSDGTFQSAPMLRMEKTELRAKFLDLATPKPIIVNRGPTEAVVLQLEKNVLASVAGRIIDPQGRPLKNAHVLLIDRTPQTTYNQDAGLTDDQGNYKVDSLWPDLQYSVLCNGKNLGRTVSAMFHLTSGQTFQVPDLTLYKLDSTIAGVLLDQQNKPVSSKRVLVRGPRTGPQNMVTDANGAFQTPVVSGDELTLIYNFGVRSSISQQSVRPGDTTIVIHAAAPHVPAPVRFAPSKPAPPPPLPAPVIEQSPLLDPAETTWSGWLAAIIILALGGVVTLIARAITAIRPHSTQKKYPRALIPPHTELIPANPPDTGTSASPRADITDAPSAPE